MNIVYTVNDKFVPQLATGMTSIFENNKEEQIHIYVISDGITDTNKKKLEEYVQKYQQEIDIIELGNVEEYFDFEVDTSGWNNIVLARLILENLLPKHVERILYLDGDTMVRGSLQWLDMLDMGDKMIGAVVEPTANKERKEILGIDVDKAYYNAGVLLIDMKKWKERGAGKQVLDYYKAHDGKLFANDQDAINGALKDDIYELPVSYNFCNSYRFYPYKTLVKMMSPAKFFELPEYESMRQNPIIIHFLGEERPWRIGNKNPFTAEYLKYWKATPWQESPMEEGWERYFICFNLFNACMKPFPMLRYRIMDKLIPMMIKHRKKS